MSYFILKNIGENLNPEKELDTIGFDSAYRKKFTEKFLHQNIKIFGLSSAQANILKQIALTVGADCAVNKNVILGNIDKSDAILCGSISQLKKIAEKLTYQPFKLKLLSEELLLFLNTPKRTTKLVGILNVTQNSFSDGGLYFEPKNAQKHLLEMIEDGADVIDVGAESTKPFSNAICAEEQIERLKPILKFIAQENITIPISIDTRSSEVADFALNNGASIINDVSGFDYNKNMPTIISKYNASVVIQHSKGTPDIMQNKPEYNNVVEEIYLALQQKIEFAKENGIKNVIIDPGIGFGKTQSHNLEILNNINDFTGLGVPIMVGISRKSFLGVKSEDNILKDALSLAVSYPLIQKGIDFLRVHNVKLHQYLRNLHSINSIK